MKIDSPHVKHNWTPFLRELFNDAVYCSDFITSMTNECVSKEYLWNYVGSARTLCRTENFSWCHSAHHILHYNQFAIKNKLNTHLETFTVLHFSRLIFTLPRSEEHFNSNKTVRHFNNISDVRSVS